MSPTSMQTLSSTPSELSIHGANPTTFPKAFIWPDAALSDPDPLEEPLVDLSGFFRRDPDAIQRAANLVRSACVKHGFFQVINHGVDSQLINAATDHASAFFQLPMSTKVQAEKKLGSYSGFSSAHAERYSSKLPWKETLSFGFHENVSDVVVNYFDSTFGKELEQTGLVYQKYCEAMKELSLALAEILGVSLGIDDHKYYKEFFQDSSSIMRCNYYPPCFDPSQALGTGPHCDPTSITILHQDQVGGLEVLADNKWKLVRPRPGALVINIGDTFTALSNGRYKSCLHRVLVNKEVGRISLAFFVNPREDKMVRPPQDLVKREGTRKYPDFTWSDLFRFTQYHHRADESTLQDFNQWLLSSKPIQP